MLQPTHYVPDNMALRFGDNKCVWQGVVCVDEEVGGVILGKAHPVDVDDRFEVSGVEPPQGVVLLNQQRGIQIFPIAVFGYMILSPHDPRRL